MKKKTNSLTTIRKRPRPPSKKVVALNHRPPTKQTKANMPTTYDRADAAKIYQTNPHYSRPSQFRPKGWTDSVASYINEAKQWAMCGRGRL